MITQKELIEFAKNVCADFHSRGKHCVRRTCTTFMTELPCDGSEWRCEHDGICYCFDNGYICAYEIDDVANTFVDVFYDEEGFYNKIYIH